VLCEVAERLKSVLRESDIISRFGGDEFAIVFPSVGTDGEIKIVKDKIAEALAKPLEVGGMSVQLKASIGFSVFPRDGNNAGELLKKADKAMYVAKGSDQNGYYIYNE
jgi:diguanylate cyclase (GGDEF)-like protein